MPRFTGVGAATTSLLIPPPRPRGAVLFAYRRLQRGTALQFAPKDDLLGSLLTPRCDRRTVASSSRRRQQRPSEFFAAYPHGPGRHLCCVAGSIGSIASAAPITSRSCI